MITSFADLQQADRPPDEDKPSGLTNEALEFLRSVLPEPGDRCITTIKNGRVQQFFGSTNGWAARVATKVDAEPEAQVFFGCASYKDNTSRKAENVLAVRLFWLDLDVGEKKDYATKAEAVTALHGFCEKVGIPMPTLVSSGNGIHAYWIVDRDMTPAEWHPVARALAAAAAFHSFKVDRSRTKDIASILRPVGVHHKKGEPKLVKLLTQYSVVSYERLTEAFANFFVDEVEDDLGETPEWAKGTSSDLAGERAFAPSYADRIADKCAIVGSMRGGPVSQPIWYHTLALLAKCEDGEAKAHEWSALDKRYTKSETAREFARAGKHGPSSCEKFFELDPGVCSACPMWGRIKTPISLGGTQSEPEPTETADDQARERSKEAGPRPLPRKLLSVQPCRLDFAPDRFQAAIRDIAEGVPTPLDYVMTAVLTTGGSLLGNRVSLDFKRHGVWLERPNAWGMVIGDPSAKKSPAIAPLRAELTRLEEDALTGHQVRMLAYQQAQIVYDQQIAAVKKTAATAASKAPGSTIALPPMPVEPQKPTPRRHVTSDSSYEAVGVLCRDNPRGVLIAQDELSGLLGEMAKPERQAAKAFMLSGWSGNEGYTFDRIGRGAIVLGRYSLSVFGGIQPALLERLMINGARSGAGADGFAQRFGMMVWPDPLPGVFVDRRCDLQARQELSDAFDELANVDPVALGAQAALVGGSPTFQLSDSAYAQFVSWHDGWLTPAVSDAAELGAYRQHVAKLPKVVATVAILIHVLAGGGAEIDGPTMARAIDAAKYFASHARRVYSAVTRSGYEPARQLARRISIGEVTGYFTARDASRRGWSGMATPDDATQALEVLEDHGWLIRSERPANAIGRPSTSWTVSTLGRGAPWG